MVQRGGAFGAVTIGFDHAIGQVDFGVLRPHNEASLVVHFILAGPLGRHDEFS